MLDVLDQAEAVDETESRNELLENPLPCDDRRPEDADEKPEAERCCA